MRGGRERIWNDHYGRADAQNNDIAHAVIADKSWGISHGDALVLVDKLYTRPIYRKMTEDTNPEGIMERKFPALNCREGWGCDDCQANAAGMCNARAELPIFERIGEAMAQSRISQAALAQALQI